MRDVHREITGWLKTLGVQATVDAVGNLRGLYSESDAHAKRLLIGSHLDTVPNAGAYDGILGVMLAIALLEGLDGKKLPYAIEIVGFSDEEGVRFGIPFLGSRALVGRVDEKLLSAQDAAGVSLQKAIADFGLSPSRLRDAAIKDDVCAYLEFHIEQGPVLDTMGLPLGVVEAIAGQSRSELTFIGRANHAGTTPMNLRHDAVAGAAEWIAEVEKMAKETSGLVATVGSVETRPGAANVIAGEVRLSLDVRHRADDIRLRIVDDLQRQADQIAQRRGLTVQSKLLMNQKAVAMDSFLCAQIADAIRKSGCEPHTMVSGAGHDAMILAEKVPAGMIFLRTTGGISHHPAEAVGIDDVTRAIECGLYLLHQLAAAPAFQGQRA
jgi:allantoate deiminase